MKTRTEIINNIIQTYGYRAYLEIGVDDPRRNFYHIVAKDKTGVDPAVRNVRYVQNLTSDDFFRRNTRRYDCIFIDGLHYADQVIKDIDNALRYLAPGGTVIVHDCYPTTKEMQTNPRIQGEWTGDVWRAWCHFRQRPDLNMRVLDTDYGVGVIRRGKQIPIEFDYENCTYEYFADNAADMLYLVSAEMPQVTIAIPAFEQYGKGHQMLDQLLRSIYHQRNANYRILVHDNANNKRIEAVCKEWQSRLPMMQRHHTTNRGGSASLNTLLDLVDKFAPSPTVKLMFQDDLFLHVDAMRAFCVSSRFDNWALCHGYSINVVGQKTRPRVPYYSDIVVKNGSNTIGMPSVMAHRRSDLRFDPKLKTLLDADFYRQLYHRYGEPAIIKHHYIGSRYWDKSTSRQQGSYIPEELPYLVDKYKTHVEANY